MKNLVAILLGNILEWYEFSIFIFLGHYITRYLGLSQSVAYISIGLAISFLSRPIGAVLFGYWGDKWGRKYTLMLSVSLMALATSLMGCIPSGVEYKLLGVTLLFTLRLLQGISGGGEFTTSISALYELKPDYEPRFITSLAYASAQLGFCLGLLVAFVITDLINKGILPEYAWRITFIAGFPVGIFIYLLRRHQLFDSRNKKLAIGALGSHLNNLFKKHFYSVKSIFFMNAYAQLLFYMFSFHILRWNRVCQLDGQCSFYDFASVSGYLILLIISIPCFARLFRAFSLKGIMQFSSILTLACCFWMSLLPDMVTAKLVFLLSLGALLSCLPKHFSSLLPRKYRNAGLSIPFNFAAAIFGGLTPLVYGYFDTTPSGQLLGCLYILFSFALFYNQCMKRQWCAKTRI